MNDDMNQAFQRLRDSATSLPEIQESTSYGTPCLKVGKKFLGRVKDAGTVVLMCALEEKEMLMAAAPHIFFETDHYKDWPAILIRMDKISDEELRHRVALAWRMQAPKRLVAAMDERS